MTSADLPGMARRRSPARLRVGSGLLAALLSLSLAACSPLDEGSEYDGPREASPAVPYPLVEHDLAEITATGIIRMITRYNSSSYFVHKGGQAGFDYELFSRYARNLGLAVEVVIPTADEDLVSLLNAGAGDVICAGQTSNEVTDRWAASTRPYNFVSKVVVLPVDDTRPDDLPSLAGLTITLPVHSTLRGELQQMKETLQLPLFLNTARPLVEEEELIAMVGRGEIQATVADDVVVRAAMTYLDGIRIGAQLSDRRPVVWMVRNNSPELRASLNEYLKRNFWVNEEGFSRRSHSYGIIYDRYYENESSIRNFQEQDHRPDKSGRISEYDELIQQYAAAAELDWRLVAALIYEESRFYAPALSKAGARGLMQVMPQFAGAEVDSLFYPEPNIRSGMRILSETYTGYAYLDSVERWRFTLATYHAGHGHISDARRLAMEQGADPNHWYGAVDKYVERLMQRRWYDQTRYGFLRGAETVVYVDNILSRYQTYIRLLPLPEAEPEPPALAQRPKEPDLGSPGPSDPTDLNTQPVPPPD